jgi:hypothetical protein
MLPEDPATRTYAPSAPANIKIFSKTVRVCGLKSLAPPFPSSSQVLLSYGCFLRVFYPMLTYGCYFVVDEYL